MGALCVACAGAPGGEPPKPRMPLSALSVREGPTPAAPRATNVGFVAAHVEPSAVPQSLPDSTFRPGTGRVVDDCNGGKTTTPYWLTRLFLGIALCVKGKPGGVNVNIGTNLSKADDSESGDGAFQEYYALGRVVAGGDENKVVWAVCGGGGAALEDSTFAVPGPSLPSRRLEELRRIVSDLEAEEKEHDAKLRAWMRTSEPDSKALFQEDLVRIEEAIDTQLAFLRAAVIHENKAALSSMAIVDPAPSSNSLPRRLPAPPQQQTSATTATKVNREPGQPSAMQTKPRIRERIKVEPDD